MPTTAPALEAIYQRPVKGTLHVHLDNGESFPATDADLVQFKLVTEREAYMRFSRALRDALRTHGLLDNDDLTAAALNPIRALAETAIMYPDLLDNDDRRDVAAIERSIRALLDARKSLPPLPWSPRDADDDPTMVEYYRDASGEEMSFTNLVVRHALVDIVNASTELED